MNCEKGKNQVKKTVVIIVCLLFLLSLLVLTLILSIGTKSDFREGKNGVLHSLSGGTRD